MYVCWGGGGLDVWVICLLIIFEHLNSKYGRKYLLLCVLYLNTKKKRPKVHLRLAITNTNAKVMLFLLLQKPVFYHAKATLLVAWCKHQTENT